MKRDFSEHALELEKIVNSDVPLAQLDAQYEKFSLALDAAEEDLEIIDMGVGDGHCWYARIQRDREWSIFYLLTGGFDKWTLPIGLVFAIPTDKADVLIGQHRTFRDGWNKMRAIVNHK